MGILDAIKDLGSAAIKTAVLPVSATLDVVTLGGALVDKEETFTGHNLKKLKDSLQDAYDEVIDD
jgi:hypothetical protein